MPGCRPSTSDSASPAGCGGSAAGATTVALPNYTTQPVASDNVGVMSVTVRVEKLELGPGSVGVEITRQCQSEVADVYQLYPTAAGKARLSGSD